LVIARLLFVQALASMQCGDRASTGEAMIDELVQTGGEPAEMVDESCGANAKPARSRSAAVICHRLASDVLQTAD
jgi:hypothetical protein